MSPGACAAEGQNSCYFPGRMTASRAWVPLLCLLLSCGDEPAAPVAEPESDPSDPSEPGPPALELEGLRGFWSQAQAEELLSVSRTFDIEADTSPLRDGERNAMERLMLVGEIFHRLYEESRHAQATEVTEHLTSYAPANDEERAQLASLRRLYQLFEGPIARTLDGEHVRFAPVEPGYQPGRNVYPSGVEREELEAYVQAHPEQRAITATRTIVRRRGEAELEADRAVMEAHPWIAALHPGLEARLAAPADGRAFYGVPYALAYADEMLEASHLLAGAATDVRELDPDLADYFEQRARDLLTNDYEAGDAAWVSGRFERLNAQVGAYETYDDALLGQKAFFSMSILIRQPEASEELERAVSQLAGFEAALPGGPYERVRGEIPIGIYEVVADYGQARGGNTATILPNEAHITRKYGRTILIRGNIITNPDRLESAQARFAAAVAAEHADDLGERGNFDRTVWHEVGHYLGPKTTEDGRVVTEALGQWHNHIEEMKADLVSLWLMPRLVATGVLDEERVRAAYAAGILRTLVTSRPPRDRPYATMMLMQQNWFLEHGVLRFDAGRLHIDYVHYPAAVEAMLGEVLRIQRGGDPGAAEAFIDRWARWDDDVQGVLGAALHAAAPRYWIAEYAALREAR